MSGNTINGNFFLPQSISDLTVRQRNALVKRASSYDESVGAATREIIRDVRNRGDGALREMGLRFDGASLDRLEVSRSARLNAVDALDPELRQALERTIRNLESVQRSSLPVSTEAVPEPGIRIGRRPDPLDRIGVYAPGGRAAYPSSVLMGAVPARVAGVREVVLCSPPESNGLPSQVVLAAAELAAVDRVFAIGGAGAIAAMAYGTESVPRVDRIVGPGNAYVAEAKLQVAGVVGIDSPAGPSELLIIADSSADPGTVAREMLAQAEHDPRAVVILVTVGREMAESVFARLTVELPSQQRRDIMEESLRSRGAVLWAADVSEAVNFNNEFAPEHLMLATRNALEILPTVRNAGTVFVGECSSVSFGDYMTGANHVLPTGGLARSYSGLSVLDFIRWTTYQIIESDAAGRLADDVGVFADSEGLPAHAAAARHWSTTGARLS
jgi:histidinol dehydrogenase